MTEYDYSPDAVERYLAKQNSVARWVDRQAHEARAYGNPFVPPTPVLTQSGTGASSSANTKPVSRSASTPVGNHRARTSTIAGTGTGSTTTAHTGRSHREHRDRDRAMNTSATHTRDVPRYSSGGTSGTGTSSQTHSRSQSQGYPSRRPPPARSNTYALAKNSASSTHLPTRSATLPAQPQHAQQTTQYTAPGGTVVMQNGRQTYVFPPHGARIHIPPQQVQGQQTASPTSYAPPYPHQQAAYPVVYAQQPISPTSTAKKQPLLKRIFGTASNTNNNANPNEYYASSRRAGGGVPVISASGARRRTTSMHY